MKEYLNILGLENSFTAAALRLAYDNYCRSNPPGLFLNDLYDESHSRKSLEEMKSMFEMLMSSISHNEYEKQVRVKKTEEVSQVGVIIVNSIGLTMAFIKPGSFIMGRPPNGRRSIFLGKEQHVVTLTKGFYLGTVPITQFQWQKVMGTQPKDLSGNEYFSAPGHPAYYVDWNDCQKFLENLNLMEGSRKFRLPTEAEWEYSCRAGSFSKFYHGDDDSHLGLYGWYGGIKRLRRPREVGLLQPNQWGLYDMLGNVWEWCQDWITLPDQITVDAIDPSGPNSGGYKVVRGGSWHDEQPGALGCAATNFYDPRRRSSKIGFRVAMDI